MRGNGNVDDEQLEEERMMYDREGNKVEGFASSVVPTLEEQHITEQKQDSSGSNNGADGPRETSNGSPPQARVQDGSKELYGAPADASKDARTDDEPPHARSGKTEASHEEEAAVQSRQAIRKHVTAKIGSRNWTLMTPTPEVDPHGFEDPISDEFWKGVWTACAVHNVRTLQRRELFDRLS